MAMMPGPLHWPTDAVSQNALRTWLLTLLNFGPSASRGRKMRGPVWVNNVVSAMSVLGPLSPR